MFTRRGGERIVDIVGPYPEGLPVTSRNVGKQQWPRYLLCGAFVPFGEKAAKARYEREVRDRQAAGLDGPILLETTTSPGSQTLILVEAVPSKSVGDGAQAIMRIISRIDN